MINAAVRNSIRGSGRQAYPHQVARALPRTGLLLYLGRPNLEAADVPIGDAMFLLPADADIRAATGWVSGTVNLFYDADGVPIAVTASEIAAWPSINQWNVLFHSVSADSGRLAVYAADTPIAVLNKALKILRETALDLTPTIFWNGLDTTGKTSYTGGPTYAPDHLGVLRSPGANLPAIEGFRLDGTAYKDTLIDGVTPIVSSVDQPTRTSGTVLDGTELGPELVVNGDFSGGITGWTANANAAGVTVVGGVLTYPLTHGDYAEVKQLSQATIGKTYKGSVNIVSKPADGNFVVLQYGRASIFYGAATALPLGVLNFTVIATHTDGFSISCRTDGAVNIDNVSVKEVLPAFTNAFTPSTTFKDYTRPTPLTAPGWLCEPARTNKVTCRKANPVDTTGLTKSGDAAAVLSVVDDTAALTAAGLIGVCNSGKVYKFDNSLGTINASTIIQGDTTNINVHSFSCFARNASLVATSASFYIGSFPANSSVIKGTSSYLKCSVTNFVPTGVANKAVLYVTAGSIVYFILPQLEEGSFSTSPITIPTDPLTTITRAGTVLTYPTAGKIRSNDIALKLSVVPRGTGQSGYLWGSYTDASNFCYISINPYNVTFKSVVAGISKDVAIASYTHTKDVPFEVILCKSIQGSQLLVREYTGGAWQAWVRGGLSVTGDNLVLSTSYTLGSFNNTSQFTGNISEIDSLLIPSGIANPTAWVESQWDVNGN